MAKQAKHYIRHERLQLEDSILLFKKITMPWQAGNYIRDKRLEIQDSIVLLLKVHCGKANNTLR